MKNYVTKILKSGFLTAVLVLIASAGFAVNVHVHLRDHNGNATLSGMGAYYNGSWQAPTATDGGGNVELSLSPGSYYFNMKYSNYTQQVGPITISGTDWDVNFQTTLVTLRLVDHLGNPITSTDAGIGNYNTGAWYPMSAGSPAGGTGLTGTVSKELLPGAGYFFNMKYHNYTQQIGSMSVVTGGSFTQDVIFRTTLVSLNLKDHNGTMITSSTDTGIGGYNTGAWYTLGGTTGTGKTCIELLPGAGYFFNMKYHNYTQQQGSMSVGSGGSWTQDINFHTTLVTLNLKDHTGALITGEDGVGGYNTGAWYTLGSTAGTGKTCIELLAGSGYFFNMRFHNFTQQQGSMSVAGGGTWAQAVNFQTTQVTLNLKDHNGALITSSTDTGIGGYNTGAWYTLGGTTGTGKNVIELLPGSGYFFNMRYHNYTQQVGSMSVTGGGPCTQAIDFHTTLVSVNLKNCAGNLIPTSSATARYNNGAWYALPAIAGGTTSIELLAGSGYYFDMNYNYGVQQKGSMAVPPGSPWTWDVDFKTTKVTFSNPNSVAIQYNQSSWNSFTPNSMELLPGNYYFKVTGGGATISKSVSGCAQDYFIQPSGSLSIASLDNGSCGGSYMLTAPAGAKSYSWAPGGATTQSIIANAVGIYSVTVAYDFTATGAAGGSSTYTANVTSVSANTVTVRLQDSHGNGLPDGAVSYYHGGWFTFGSGTTDANGYACAVLPSGSNSVRITYKGGSKQWDGVIASGNPVLIASTASVNVNLKDHTGNLITGEAGTASCYEGAWTSLGSTGVAGFINLELLPGSYAFSMNFHTKTYQPSNFTINAGANDVDFTTTLASINVKDCAGNLLNGAASTSYYGNGWSAPVNFSTGSTQVELLQGSYSVAMDYNHSHQQINSVIIGAGPTQPVDFNTTKVTISNPNASAVSYYQSGWNTFTQPSMELLPGTFIFHSNGSAPNVSIAVSGCAKTLYITPCALPGIANVGNGCGASSTLTAPAGASYSWAPAAGLSATTGACVIASPSVTTTYSVTVGYDFTCAGTAGVAIVYTTSVTAATTNTYTVRLINSTGSAIPGAEVQYYNGSWQNFTSGTTNSGGYACTSLSPGSYYFRVNYAHGSQQWSATVAAYNDIYTVQTTNVNVRLLNSGGNLITATDAGSGVQYYSGGWWNVDGGTTGNIGTASIELLQGSYIFHLTYAHATQQLSASTIGAGPSQDVDFKTTAVNATLTANNGAGAGLSGGIAQYYSGTWYDLGTTNGAGTTPVTELLPLSYIFHITYAHATYQTASLPVSGPSTAVPFTTISVKATLKGNGGIGAGISGGVAEYYSGAWYSVGTTDGTGATPTVELLPVSYPFHMTYNFATFQTPASVVVATTPTVAFATTTVKASLKSNGGLGGGLSSGQAQYYSGGWWDIGTTDGTGLTPSIELLQGAYPFRISYAHATYQTPVNVSVSGATTNALFTTTTVTASLRGNGGSGSWLSGGVAQYYSGGWWNLGTTDGSGYTQSVELLPLSYPFNISYNYATYQIPGSVAVTGSAQNVPFTTSTVNVNFADHADVPLDGGVAQFYSGGWHDIGTTAGGTTSAEMLPGSYYFHMTYNYGTYQPASVPVSGATTPVPFKTAGVVIHFQGNLGDAHGGATIGYYSGGWHYMDDVTDVNGNSTMMEMLPVPYYYNATLAGYGTTQVGPFTDAEGADGSLYVVGTGYHIIQSSLAAKPGTPGVTATGTTEFGVYPNPATDRITIKFTGVQDGSASLKVADMSGKVIIQQQVECSKGANTHEIDLSNFASGIYLLSFDQDGNSEVRKISVQH